MIEIGLSKKCSMKLKAYQVHALQKIKINNITHVGSHFSYFICWLWVKGKTPFIVDPAAVALQFRILS